MSTALRSVGLLDVLSKYACGALGRAPCIHARLRRLATKSGEKCGLEVGAGCQTALGEHLHPMPRPAAGIYPFLERIGERWHCTAGNRDASPLFVENSGWGFHGGD